MKAVLVIDKPTKCEECPLYVDAIMSGWCVLNIADIVDCPLKPLPKKKLVLGHIVDGNRVNDSEVAEAHGYNKCLEDITNEP